VATKHITYKISSLSHVLSKCMLVLACLVRNQVEVKLGEHCSLNEITDFNLVH
jgi:hypothetical protein